MIDRASSRHWGRGWLQGSASPFSQSHSFARGRKDWKAYQSRERTLFSCTSVSTRILLVASDRNPIPASLCQEGISQHGSGASRRREVRQNWGLDTKTVPLRPSLTFAFYSVLASFSCVPKKFSHLTVLTDTGDAGVTPLKLLLKEKRQPFVPLK